MSSRSRRKSAFPNFSEEMPSWRWWLELPRNKQWTNLGFPNIQCFLWLCFWLPLLLHLLHHPLGLSSILPHYMQSSTLRHVQIQTKHECCFDSTGHVPGLCEAGGSVLGRGLPPASAPELTLNHKAAKFTQVGFHSRQEYIQWNYHFSSFQFWIFFCPALWKGTYLPAYRF